MEEKADRYYGKYRGTVLNNVDPMKQGRLMLQVPDVLGVTPSTWATPCVPVAGLQYGMFVVPPVGAGVWVEFERGDSDAPIWVGGWWGSLGEVPALSLLATPGIPVVIIGTPLQNALVISDVPIPPMLAGGLMLQSGPSSITIDPSGVKITAPTIQVVGLTEINNGALTVTL